MTAAAEVVLLAGPELRAELGPVAELLAAAYPPQAIRMDRHYLGAILAPLAPHQQPVAALARRQGQLVGFAGAAPAACTVNDATHDGWIVSWVAVHPIARGEGLAARLYQQLLRHLGQTGPGMIHTFAQEGTRGATLIETCYPAAGWHSRELVPLESWGALRRRIRPVPDPASRATSPGTDLTLVATETFRQRLEADPRRVDAAPEHGARVLTVAFNDPAQDPVGTIEFLAPDPSPASVVAVVTAAATTLPAVVSRLVIPNLPPSAESAARAMGFRRLPTPPWRNWVCSRDAAHPVLRTTRTAIPVT